MIRTMLISLFALTALLIDTRAAEGWVADGTQLRFLTLKESAGNRDYGIAMLDMPSRKVTPLVDPPNSAQHSSASSPVRSHARRPPVPRPLSSEPVA